MPRPSNHIVVVTRGSPLALAQTHQVAALCRAHFPDLLIEVRIVKTTGDKLRKASLANPDANLPKGLFTKELENALLEESADIAVHSLKDLPTELPAGLVLNAVTEREDPRDVLLWRGDLPQPPPAENARPFPQLPHRTLVATSSTRRREQLLAARPDLRLIEIRGNIETRMSKVVSSEGPDATILAAAGLHRLGIVFERDGHLSRRSPPPVPSRILATLLDFDVMLPAVGQAAIGIETRADDPKVDPICRLINHARSHQCVKAERAFLRAMGGGCQSPVAALAQTQGQSLHLRALAFTDGQPRRHELKGQLGEAEALGAQLAQMFR